MCYETHLHVIKQSTAQINFSGPKKYFRNFGNFRNFSSVNKCLLGAGIRWNTIEKGQEGPRQGQCREIFTFLSKVLFNYNYKYCQRAQTFSQGQLKLTSAQRILNICNILSQLYMQKSIFCWIQYCNENITQTQPCDIVVTYKLIGYYSKKQNFTFKYIKLHNKPFSTI